MSKQMPSYEAISRKFWATKHRSHILHQHIRLNRGWGYQRVSAWQIVPIQWPLLPPKTTPEYHLKPPQYHLALLRWSPRIPWFYWKNTTYITYFDVFPYWIFWSMLASAWYLKFKHQIKNFSPNPFWILYRRGTGISHLGGKHWWM